MTAMDDADRVLVTSFDKRDGDLLAKLFAPTERWGWEHRAPTTRPLPISVAPVLSVPAPRSAAAACNRAEVFSAARAATLAVLFAVAALAFGAEAASWDASTASQPSGAHLHFSAWTPYLWLAAAVFGAWALIATVTTRRALHRWMSEVVARRQAHERAKELWSAGDKQRRVDEGERQLTEPQWFAIHLDGLKHLDVFGGTAEGWGALLVSIGCSLLGAGGDVNVVDLSRDNVAEILLRAAETYGYSTSELALPKDSVVTDVFGAMDAAQVADVLAETANGADSQPDNAQRSLDTRLLTAVCGALDTPLTTSRVCAGLRLLLNQEPAPGAAGAQLGEQEYDRITGLFAESYLQHAAPRLAVLESVLHPLAVLGRDAGHFGAALYAPHTRLQAVRITDDTTALSAEAAAQFVLQVLLSGLRSTSNGAAGARRRTVIVAGADELRGGDAERLVQLARRRGIRVILLFRHLRDDAERLLGASDSVYFMRLGNAAEANRAAEFIGREHRFVVHQSSLSVTDGTSESENFGRSASFGRSSTTSGHGGGSGKSSTSTTSGGTTTGTSHSLADSTGRQRVYEFAVEPTALQSLPPSVFVFVDPSRPRPRARLGNCDPRLLRREITRDHPVQTAAP